MSGRWINNDIWQDSSGKYFDKWGRPLGPPPSSRPPPSRPPPSGQSQSYGPQVHHHDHYELGRTHSASQAVPNIYNLVPDRGRSSGDGSHSRSRSRSSPRRDEDYYRLKFEREHREAEERAHQAVLDAEHEREEQRKEHEKLIEEAKRKEKEKREKEAEERKRIAREERERQKEEEEKEDRLLREVEQKRKDRELKKKEERERIEREIADEKQREKEKEVEEEKRWELKKKQRELEAKEKKEKEEREYLERVQLDLAKFGMTPKQVETMIKHKEEDEKKKKKHGIERSNSRRRHKSHDVAILEHSPVYPKIHRDDIEIETLEHYDIAWERDSHERNYIILLEELTEEETEVLFKHTKKLRKEKKHRRGSMLLEAAPKQPEYAFVRRRSQTRGSGERSHSRVRDKSPLRERMAEAIVRRS